MKPVYVKRSTEIAARMLGGCMMIMSARDSSLFSLNEIGSLIWNAADGRTPLRDIVEDIICAQFDITAADALADAEKFVTELADHGIVTISDQPIDAPCSLEPK